MSKPETIYIKAHIQDLMEMCARDLQNPGISIGFAVCLSYISKIAKRAVELNDDKLIAYLYQIGALEVTSKRAIAKINKTLDNDK
jgi:lactam utilization protein B